MLCLLVWSDIAIRKTVCIWSVYTLHFRGIIKKKKKKPLANAQLVCERESETKTIHCFIFMYVPKLTCFGILLLRNALVSHILRLLFSLSYLNWPHGPPMFRLNSLVRQNTLWRFILTFVVCMCVCPKPMGDITGLEMVLAYLFATCNLFKINQFLGKNFSSAKTTPSKESQSFIRSITITGVADINGWFNIGEWFKWSVHTTAKYFTYYSLPSY